jgi:hypothetical protein
MDNSVKIYATKVGDMYGTGDRWCGVELTIIKDGIQITLNSNEVRELDGCMERVGGMANQKQKHSAPQSGL